jgi:hypothetical protein
VKGWARQTRFFISSAGPARPTRRKGDYHNTGARYAAIGATSAVSPRCPIALQLQLGHEVLEAFVGVQTTHSRPSERERVGNSHCFRSSRDTDRRVNPKRVPRRSLSSNRMYPARCHFSITQMSISFHGAGSHRLPAFGFSCLLQCLSQHSIAAERHQWRNCGHRGIECASGQLV